MTIIERKITLPELCLVRRRLPQGDGFDPIVRLREEWQNQTMHERVSGQRIALGFGSRGVEAIVDIARELVTLIRDAGGDPFIIPAMGSHGGATPEGQAGVLHHLGIDEDSVGCPIRATMETVIIGETERGLPVHVDRFAAEADGIILTNRVKPHTDFHDRHESGLVKMLAIGFGKETGAELIHRRGLNGLREDIPQVAKVMIDNLNILGGVATVEDGYHQVAALRILPGEDIMSGERKLLDLARELMPKLPVEDIDVLVIDQMGKEISGAGMDTNIIGRMRIDGEPEPETPRIEAIVVLDLTDTSHGNATGIGFADFTTQRLLDKIDFPVTSKNVFVSGFLRRGFIPMVYPTAEEAISAAIDHVFRAQPHLRSQARIVHIRDTLSLETVHVSPNLLDEIRRSSDFVSAEQAAPITFND